MELTQIKQCWLVICNVLMAAQWVRVVLVLIHRHQNGGWDDSADSEEICQDVLSPTVKTALLISTIELFNSIFKITRSKPHQVLLFASVRMGVEVLTSPILPSCTSWQHLWTCLCWSSGEVVRFGCFALDAAFALLSVNAPSLIKSVRYTVGPLLFPLGAGGEMLMVIKAAQDDRPVLYVAASLWPAGFYPLMKQLLKQRKRHFEKVALSAGDEDGKPEKKFV